MDHSATSLDAQHEIDFVLSLLRISYPGEALPEATGAIEQLLTVKALL
jgi:hypothetical protein